MFYKLLFYITLLMSIFINVSSNSWFMMWFSLEMNLLCIIPLMYNKTNLTIETSMKYFIIQSIASSMILLSIILTEFNMTNLMLMAILLKMGMSPFHFWYPNVLDGLSWECNLIMMTWQKIPLLNIMSLNINTDMIYMIILLNSIISTIQSMNQISLRKFLAYSSINHMTWIISNFMVSISNMMIYFMIYMLISAMLIFPFKLLNIFLMKNLLSINNFITKLILMMNFMSLGGLPPFIGFFPKWLTIQMISKNYFLLSFFMTTMTLIILYVYIRMIYSYLTITMNFKLKYELNLNFHLNLWNILLNMGLINYFYIFNLN